MSARQGKRKKKKKGGGTFASEPEKRMLPRYLRPEQLENNKRGAKREGMEKSTFCPPNHPPQPIDFTRARKLTGR